jgi:predicted RNA-binding Zn-ribbon protein involved in translation (DUF1610 family)
MDSVRKGLRNGDLERDVYDRLRCTECDEDLDTDMDVGGVGSVHACPECGTEWREL